VIIFASILVHSRHRLAVETYGAMHPGYRGAKTIQREWILRAVASNYSATIKALQRASGPGDI